MLCKFCESENVEHQGHDKDMRVEPLVDVYDRFYCLDCFKTWFEWSHQYVEPYESDLDDAWKDFQANDRFPF